MWMPAHITPPPSRTAFSASGTRAPDRRDDDGCIQQLRPHLVGTAGPGGAQGACKVLFGMVSRPGEGEYRPALARTRDQGALRAVLHLCLESGALKQAAHAAAHEVSLVQR